MSPAIEQTLSRMSLEQKAGQVFTFQKTGSMVQPEDRKAILELHCGGFRLHPWEGAAHDYCKPGDKTNAMSPKKKYLGSPYLTPGQLAAQLNDMQDLALSRNPGIPLHYSIDQEGDQSGDYTRGGVVFVPSAMGYTAAGDLELCRRCHRLVARQLRAIGIHFVHSPVLDVNVNPDNPEIYTRSFSDDPAVVARYAEVVLDAFNREGLCGVGKHFPGRGQSSEDAHYAMPRYACTRDQMERIDLAPYRALIGKGLRAIMSAHTVYPALGDAENVATLSKVILTDFLRGELGFDGLITTDSMTMRGIVDKYGVDQACAMALAAGADLVLMKSGRAHQIACVEAVIDWVRRGRLAEARLDDAVRRILAFKENAGLFATPKVDPAKADEPLRAPESVALAVDAAERSAMVLKNDGVLPLRPDQNILVIEQNSFFCFKTNDLYYHEGMLGEAIYRYAPATEGINTGWSMNEVSLDELQPKIAAADVIVCTNFYGRAGLMNDNVVQALIGTGKPVVVITSTPYQAKKHRNAAAILLSFLNVTHGLQVAADILFGKRRAMGTWPLQHFDWK